jgi:hypothetical protein
LNKEDIKMDLLSELQHAEFKEAFDEFDKVYNANGFKKRIIIHEKE